MEKCQNLMQSLENGDGKSSDLYQRMERQIGTFKIADLRPRINVQGKMPREKCPGKNAQGKMPREKGPGKNAQGKMLKEKCPGKNAQGTPRERNL